MKNRKSLVLLLLLAVCTVVICGCAQQEWAAVYYDIEFLKVDGSVYKTFTVQRHRGVICDMPGETQTEVTEPSGKTCIVYYKQTGWDKATSDVVSDMKVNPIIDESATRKEYTSFLVIFTDKDGNEISRQIVRKGEAAVPPEDLGEGMIAIWDIDFSCITEDIVVRGTIVAEYADYVFDAVDGTFASGESVKTYEQIRYDAFDLGSIEKPVAEHMNFKSWKLVSVENDGKLVKYEAEYEWEKYTVTFIGKDGSVIGKIENIEYGSSVAAPEPPLVAMYEFVEWVGGDLGFITGDTVFRARYRGIEVLYIYHDINGNEFARKANRYGEVPMEPEAPLVEGKTFIQWVYDSAISYDAFGNAYLNVYAEYADGVYYKVAFVVDGVLAHAQLVKEGAAPMDPTDIVVGFVPDGVKIVGWEYAVETEDGVVYERFDFATGIVTRNMTLRAVLEPLVPEGN